jgi:hypothetical protein
LFSASHYPFFTDPWGTRPGIMKPDIFYNVKAKFLLIWIWDVLERKDSEIKKCK